MNPVEAPFPIEAPYRVVPAPRPLGDAAHVVLDDTWPAAATRRLERLRTDPGGHKEYSGGGYKSNPYKYSGSGGGASGGGGYSGGGGGASPPPSGSTYNPNDPENQPKTHWVGIVLKDRTGRPMPGRDYKVVLPNGEIVTGTLDDEGKAKVEHTDPGECHVSFPGLADWEKA